MQVLTYQSDVLSHKQQAKRLQEDNQRLQNQMLATGERLEKMSGDSSLDLKKEMLKLQRQLACKHQASFTTCLCSTASAAKIHPRCFMYVLLIFAALYVLFPFAALYMLCAALYSLCMHAAVCILCAALYVLCTFAA